MNLENNTQENMPESHDQNNNQQVEGQKSEAEM